MAKKPLGDGAGDNGDGVVGWYGKWIPKADFELKDPYFYSKFFSGVFLSTKKNVKKKMDISLHFKEVKFTVSIEIFTFRSAQWVPRPQS